MKSFKQFFTEKQGTHSEFFLILAGDIKLDRGNACKIWEQCGKRDVFRHVTDYIGTEFLIKNKKKDISISAMKFSKEHRGIETSGTITLIVEGDYEIWWPQDAFTYIGTDGKRWIQMNKDAYKRIFPPEFAKEYIKDLLSMIKKKYPKIQEFVEEINYGSEEVRNLVYINPMSVMPVNKPLLGLKIPNKAVISNFEDSIFKDEVDKFIKDALALQLKYLDKYSDSIKSKLIAEFQQSKTDKTRRMNYRFGDLDEAVISNVKVKQVFFSPASDFLNILNRISDGLRQINRLKKEAKDSTTYKRIYQTEVPTAKEFKKMDDDLKKYIDEEIDDLYSVKILRRANFKGQFTYRQLVSPQFKNIKDAIKYSDYQKSWDYLLKHYGIKRDKDVFLRLV